MDETPQKPKRHREHSWFGYSLADAFARGVIISVLVDTLASLVSRGRWGYAKFSELKFRDVATTGVFTGLSFALLHKLTGHKEPQSPVIVVAPPSIIPPTAIASANPSALSQVPFILDLLVAKNQLTRGQQATVLAEIKQGSKSASGEIAIARGFITKEILDQALLEQSMLKAEAAIADINTLSLHGSVGIVPSPHWGNNGVNPAAPSPTRAEGASAAANIAQNLAALANGNERPELTPVIREGILAAANLSRGIAQGDSSRIPLAKMAPIWTKAMNDALLAAGTADPHLAQIDLNAFIAARNAEIDAAVKLTLAQVPPQKDASQGR